MTCLIPTQFDSEVKPMVHELRIYEIKPGMMDSWLKLFNEDIVPLAKKTDVPVEGAWVSPDRTQFIYLRNYNCTEDEIEAKMAAYWATPERQALGDIPGSHIATMDVRLIEPV